MESKFELLIVPNIFSIDDKGTYDFYDVISCDDYEEAICEMKKDIATTTNEEYQKTIHYDIWEYDDEDNIINTWEFDCQGNEIADFDEWLNNLTEEELKYFEEDKGEDIERKWFDIDEFMEYMRNEFPEPMRNHFTYDLLQNTVEYLMEQFDDNTYLAYTISEVVPEVTEEEVLKFCAK